MEDGRGGGGERIKRIELYRYILKLYCFTIGEKKVLCCYIENGYFHGSGLGTRYYLLLYDIRRILLGYVRDVWPARKVVSAGALS